MIAATRVATFEAPLGVRWVDGDYTPAPLGWATSGGPHPIVSPLARIMGPERPARSASY